MTILRRLKFVLVVSIGVTLFFPVIFIFHNTTQQHRSIISGKDSFINREAALEYSLHGDKNATVDPFNRSIYTDFIQYDEASLPSVETKMAARTKQVSAVCAIMKKKNLSPPNRRLGQQNTGHIIVNKEHQILYCYLPKVANTNFRRVFLGLQGIVPKSEVVNISGYDVYFKYNKTFTYMNSFKTSEQTQLVRQYKKFIVVRDPLERLLSGYRNKFFHPNKQHKADFHGRVTSFYRHYPHLRRRNNVRKNFRSKEITFKEFLIYWTDVMEVNEYLNEHFVPSNQLCNPCHIHYDYIGKYESLNNDVKYIFEHLNIDIEFPGRRDNYSSVSTSALVEEFYKPIPDWLLQKIWEIAKFDYFLFGYHLPKWFRERLKET
ncbi:carbohydrate sulfotransferase 11-like isoform X2 [Mercenaria mercenaria]|nr:carbohydrate sulfotransferase 11-like isoform X2 [Mercenaria mercenaria]